MVDIKIAVEKNEKKNVVIFSLEGSITSSNIRELDTILEDQAAEGNTRMIFDCKDLEFISSAGVGVFLKMHDDIKEKETGFIIFCNLKESVLTVFKAMGITYFFDIYDDLAQAVTSVDK